MERAGRGCSCAVGTGAGAAPGSRGPSCCPGQGRSALLTPLTSGETTQRRISFLKGHTAQGRDLGFPDPAWLIPGLGVEEGGGSPAFSFQAGRNPGASGAPLPLLPPPRPLPNSAFRSRQQLLPREVAGGPLQIWCPAHSRPAIKAHCICTLYFLSRGGALLLLSRTGRERVPRQGDCWRGGGAGHSGLTSVLGDGAGATPALASSALGSLGWG